LDKPPLTLYALALSFRALGVSEWAARLPNVLFSVLSVSVLYALARDLYRDRAVGWAAAALWAFSPYALGFAATAFTDVQAAFWAWLGMWLAVRERWAWAGVALVLGGACKTSVWQIVPLALALGTLAHMRRDWRARDLMRRIAYLAGTLSVGAGVLLLWDAARAPRSFWALARAHNMPKRLARSDEVVARLSAWLGWLRWTVGAEWLVAVLTLGALVWLARDLRHRDRAAALDWTLAGYALAFLGVYGLVAFNTYDRYLYPLVPLLLILAARAWEGVWRALGARRSVALLMVVVLGAASVPGTRAALQGDLPLGGDHRQHNGIDTLAAYLNTELADAVVYDHWLGWELGYYLGSSSRVKLRYMPQPEALADDLRAAGDVRYLVAPEREAAFWLYVLRGADMHVQRVYAVRRFAVYRLQYRRRFPSRIPLTTPLIRRASCGFGLCRYN
jgi:4-amino-4-deoxy-L-arabinose transferase-like glycosyltransferase